MRDRVDPILDYVQSLDPDRDLISKAVAIRLRRAAHYLDTEARRWLNPRGMERWELEVLARLMRRGGRLTMGKLQEAAQVTAAAMTHQIGKLETSGYVVRTIDEADRRQVIVTLTEAGRRRALEVIAANNEMEEKLLGAIDPAVLASLARDLRAFLLATEGAPEDDDDL